MPQIEIVGQVITSTNYAVKRIFNFNPDYVERAAQHFAASGVDKIEVPEGVLDPEGTYKQEGIDESKIKETISRIPEGTVLFGTYLGGGPIGTDNETYLRQKKLKLDAFFEYFPAIRYAMMHPPGAQSPATAQEVVGVWGELAEYAASKHPGFELCLHNHFDSACETAAQVSSYLDAIRKAALPALRWGPDTGHCHGMREDYLDIFRANADLIGDYFHIKARVVAFDQLHGGDEYCADRDIWGNEAEKGRGLYGGFVNVADPEIQTPFKEVFEAIHTARKDRPVVYGAMEIDNPRQHPLLEVMCGVMYLRQAHGLTTGREYSNDQIVANVFGGG